MPLRECVFIPRVPLAASQTVLRHDKRHVQARLDAPYEASFPFDCLYHAVVVIQIALLTCGLATD